MKFILRKILSDKQFTNLEIFLIEHPKAFVSAFWLVVVCFIFYFAFRPQPYEISGYVVAEVKSIQDNSGENGFSATARIELSDGSFAFASTGSMAVASNAITTICVEERLLQNGIKTYHWVSKNKCQPKNPDS